MPARRVAPTLDALSDILASEMTERSAAATAARRRGGQAEELSRLVVISDDHELDLFPVGADVGDVE